MVVAGRRYNRPMSLRRLARSVLHWLVIASMITTTLGAPVHAATDALQGAVAAQLVVAVADRPPCDGMDVPAADGEMPCGCCTPAACDLSACLGTACLADLPCLVADIPAEAIRLPWDAPAPGYRLIDTPLRPPNA